MQFSEETVRLLQRRTPILQGNYLVYARVPLKQLCRPQNPSWQLGGPKSDPEGIAHVARVGQGCDTLVFRHRNPRQLQVLHFRRLESSNALFIHPCRARGWRIHDLFPTCSQLGLLRSNVRDKFPHLYLALSQETVGRLLCTTNIPVASLFCPSGQSWM